MRPVKEGLVVLVLNVRERVIFDELANRLTVFFVATVEVRIEAQGLHLGMKSIAGGNGLPVARLGVGATAGVDGDDDEPNQPAL